MTNDRPHFRDRALGRRDQREIHIEDPGDHVAVFNLAVDGGTNNASLNVESANTAFSACGVTGHETSHGTLKISHINPGPNPASAALSIDLQAGKAGGTAARGIFPKSTTGGTSGDILHYVDPTGVTIFALLPDGSLLLRPLDARPPAPEPGSSFATSAEPLGSWTPQARSRR